MSLPPAILGAVTPLAQRSSWTRLGDRFSGSHLSLQTEDLVWAGVLVVFFVGIVALLKWFSHLEKTSRDRPNPKRLFADLCDAHGLGPEYCAALRELAEEKGLAKPVELFVRPDLFEGGSRGVLHLRDRIFSVGRD